MVGAILLVGVLKMVTIGDFIAEIEKTGHAPIVAAGLDRSAELTDGAATKIGLELGIPLTSNKPNHVIAQEKVGFLVWLMTPECHREKGHERPGHGKHHPHSRSHVED